MNASRVEAEIRFQLNLQEFRGRRVFEASRREVGRDTRSRRQRRHESRNWESEFMKKQRRGSAGAWTEKSQSLVAAALAEARVRS